MFRILSIIVSLFLIQNYALAETAPNKDIPPAQEVSKEPKEASAGNVAPAPDGASVQKDVDQHKKVIEEYKKYLSTVPEGVRDEIREYRKDVIKLNKEKISLYKKLSQEAQDFLSKERSFKKQLPFRERSKIND